LQQHKVKIVKNTFVSQVLLLKHERFFLIKYISCDGLGLCHESTNQLFLIVRIIG
jgi:hypothetical protein